MADADPRFYCGTTDQLVFPAITAGETATFDPKFYVNFGPLSDGEYDVGPFDVTRESDDSMTVAEQGIFQSRKKKKKKTKKRSLHKKKKRSTKKKARRVWRADQGPFSVYDTGYEFEIENRFGDVLIVFPHTDRPT